MRSLTAEPVRESAQMPTSSRVVPGQVSGEGAEPAESVIGDITDDELTALALAADPEAPIEPDAVPLGLYLGLLPAGLPQWYMPPVMARGGKRWRTPVVMIVVGAFLLIGALGLCNTYGTLGLA